MQLRKHSQFGRILLLMVILAFTLDLSYTGTQIVHNESTTFLSEIEQVETASNKLSERVYIWKDCYTVLLGNLFAPISRNDREISGSVEIHSPHGHHVDVYLDDRILRI